MSDDYRIEQLEKDVTEVKKDIKDIMRNHLPHLGEELSGLKSRVSIFGAIILLALAAILRTLL